MDLRAARRRSSPEHRRGSARRRCGSSARQASESPGGARRVERIDADVALPLDVTDEASAGAFVKAAVAALGGIDILFNNAGLALGRAPFTESTADDEARGAPHERRRRPSHHATVASSHPRRGSHRVHGLGRGTAGYPSGASYITAKFGLRGFVYALREDLLGRPIRISTVDAGLVETEFSLVRF